MLPPLHLHLLLLSRHTLIGGQHCSPELTTCRLPLQSAAAEEKRPQPLTISHGRQHVAPVPAHSDPAASPQSAPPRGNGFRKAAGNYNIDTEEDADTNTDAIKERNRCENSI
eukprot:m.35910 g.35910  ORF g.35910 m.35910 type:complete len:112 (+) comp11350_c0_seq1:367-702(+)